MRYEADVGRDGERARRQWIVIVESGGC